MNKVFITRSLCYYSEDTTCLDCATVTNIASNRGATMGISLAEVFERATVALDLPAPVIVDPNITRRL